MRSAHTRNSPRKRTDVRRRGARRFVTCSLISVAGVVAGACGSSGGPTAAPSTEASTTSSPASSTTAAPVVTTTHSSSLGTILVNSQGQVLYTFTKDGKAVPCDASCLAAWPPVTLPAGTSTPTGSPGVGTLGTTTSNGVTQVTVNGLPLFTFAGDSEPGVANGNNETSFGGTWKVVKTGS